MTDIKTAILMVYKYISKCKKECYYTLVSQSYDELKDGFVFENIYYYKMIPAVIDMPHEYGYQPIFYSPGSNRTEEMYFDNTSRPIRCPPSFITFEGTKLLRFPDEKVLDMNKYEIIDFHTLIEFYKKQEAELNETKNDSAD